jgi:hypothetical protein
MHVPGRSIRWELALSWQITFRQTTTGAQCENHTDFEYAECSLQNVYTRTICIKCSWHWGSYGSIWTGSSPQKYYMDESFWGPFNIFWWRTDPYTAIWPEVTWTICYIIPFNAQDKPDSVTLGTCVIMANNLSSDYHWGTVWKPYRLWICWMFFTKCGNQINWIFIKLCWFYWSIEITWFSRFE